jgi:hypothetical protein
VADTAETPVEYLEKSCEYFRTDFPEPHMPRGGQINVRAKVIASVDGNLPARLAWKGRKEQDALALTSGRSAGQIGATVGEMEQHSREHRAKVIARAREIREEGKLVPKDRIDNRPLSWIRAEIELGGRWGPIAETHGETLDHVMREHEKAGGDAAWWWAERENPTVTRGGE